MINLDEHTKRGLLDLFKSKKVYLEGNILKIINIEENTEFGNYIKQCIEKDISTRKKRLEITKQIQKQNSELISWKEENTRIQEQLIESLKNTESAMNEAEKAKEESDKARIEAEIAKNEAENAKTIAENDLEIAQKKTQFELISTIVKVALWVIISVGVITTGVFVFSLIMNKDTAIIGSTWSNIVGILLTNAFSIVGTIMGVKYASEKN